MKIPSEVPVSILATTHLVRRDSSGSISSLGSSGSFYSLEGATQIQGRRKVSQRASRRSALVGPPVAILATSSPDISSLCKRIDSCPKVSSPFLSRDEAQLLCNESSSRLVVSNVGREVLPEESSVDFADVEINSIVGAQKLSSLATAVTADTGLQREELDWSISTVNLHYSPLEKDQLKEIQEHVVTVGSDLEHESFQPIAEHRRWNANMLPSPEQYVFDEDRPLPWDHGNRRRAYSDEKPEMEVTNVRRRCFSEDKPIRAKGHRRNKLSIVLPPPVANC